MHSLRHEAGCQACNILLVKLAGVINIKLVEAISNLGGEGGGRIGGGGGRGGCGTVLGTVLRCGVRYGVRYGAGMYSRSVALCGAYPGTQIVRTFMRVPGLTSHVVLAMKRRKARGETRPCSSFSIDFRIYGVIKSWVGGSAAANGKIFSITI